MTKREIENLFKTHYTRMYRLAASILYDEDESKDVVSDIFARLLRERLRVGASAGMKYHPQQNKMESYLMSAVRNRCRDVFSHKTRLDFRNRNWKRTLRERIAGIGIGNGCGAVCNMAEQAFFT